jgi:hypothetical protein
MFSIFVMHNKFLIDLPAGDQVFHLRKEKLKENWAQSDSNFNQ